MLDCQPQIMALVVELHKHLVKVPAPMGTERTSVPQAEHHRLGFRERLDSNAAIAVSNLGSVRPKGHYSAQT